MIKKIEMPDWLLNPSFVGGRKYIAHHLVEDFWRHRIEPINRALDEAVEVYQCKEEDWQADGDWYQYPKEDLKTHKALLINIEPITHESCADVLRYLLELDNNKYPLLSEEIKDRAKAALARES